PIAESGVPHAEPIEPRGPAAERPEALPADRGLLEEPGAGPGEPPGEPAGAHPAEDGGAQLTDWHGSDSFPADERGRILALLNEMPASIRRYLVRERPFIHHLTQAEIQELPSHIRGAFAAAAAVCVNNGRIEVPEGKPPDRPTLQHELIHHFWRMIPQSIIDEATARARADGQKLFEWAKKSTPTEELEYAHNAVRNLIRHAEKAAR